MIIEKLNTNIWEQDFFWNSIFDLFLFSLKVFVFSLGLFVWRSFWSCLCVVLSVWDISLLLIQPSLLILLYFCLAFLLLSENFAYEENLRFICVVSRDMMWKLKNVFSKKNDLNSTQSMMTLWWSASIFLWDTVFTARHRISEFRTWPRSFSSLFFFSWAWILVLSWSYDHIARTPRFSHNPWWFV